MKKFILAIAYSDLGWENKKTSRSSRAKVVWYVKANSPLRPSGLICICEVAGKLQTWFRAISPSDSEHQYLESEDRLPMVFATSGMAPVTSNSMVLPITKMYHVIRGSQAVVI